MKLSDAEYWKLDRVAGLGILIKWIVCQKKRSMTVRVFGRKSRFTLSIDDRLALIWGRKVDK